jgi:PilZ domain
LAARAGGHKPLFLSVVRELLKAAKQRKPMEHMTGNRRQVQRFNIRLNLRYRVSEKGIEHRWSSGTTRDLSREGLGIKPRRPLSVGSHIEIRIDWPARYEAVHPVELQITGFVIRSENGRAAVRISSHRFLVLQDGVDAQQLGRTA